MARKRFRPEAIAAKIGCVMFIIDDKSLDYVRSSKGWEVGAGPNLLVADEGAAQEYSTTTTMSGVYVFFVGQKGFFAGAGIEGAKISRNTR